MQLVDIKEIAKVLDVKPKTIYQWVEMGKMPYRKLGKLVRFDLQEIIDWANNKRVGEGCYNKESKKTQAGSPRNGGQS